jgi:hypothetical protein
MSKKNISRYCPFIFAWFRGGGGEDWEHEASDILAIEKEFREREAKELSLDPVEGGGGTERGKRAVKRAARQFAKLGSARFLRPFCIGRYVNKAKKRILILLLLALPYHNDLDYLLQFSNAIGIWTFCHSWRSFVTLNKWKSTKGHFDVLYEGCPWSEVGIDRP